GLRGRAATAARAPLARRTARLDAALPHHLPRPGQARVPVRRPDRRLLAAPGRGARERPPGGLLPVAGAARLASRAGATNWWRRTYCGRRPPGAGSPTSGSSDHTPLARSAICTYAGREVSSTSSRGSSMFRCVRIVLVATAVAGLAAITPSAGAYGVNQSVVVSPVPVNYTPNILDG